jgi:hypothetical protein
MPFQWLGAVFCSSRVIINAWSGSFPLQTPGGHHETVTVTATTRLILETRIILETQPHMFRIFPEHSHWPRWVQVTEWQHMPRGLQHPVEPGFTTC